MASRLLANHAAPLAVPNSGKTAIPGTTWLAFANAGSQVLVIDTVGGEEAVSILSTTTVTSIIGFWE
jgi:hypothetical protein